jgi:hypothetical protein
VRFDKKSQNSSEFALERELFKKILTIGRKLNLRRLAESDLTADMPPRKILGSKKKHTCIRRKRKCKCQT